MVMRFIQLPKSSKKATSCLIMWHIAFLFFCFSHSVLATSTQISSSNYYVTNPGTDYRLNIKNLSDETASLWILSPIINGEESEQALELQPNQQVILNLAEFPNSNWLQIKNPGLNQIQIYLSKKNQKVSNTVPLQISDSLRLDRISQSTSPRKIRLINLSGNKQFALIKLENSQSHQTTEIKTELPAFEKSFLDLDKNFVGTVLISASYTLIATLETENKMQHFEPIKSTQRWPANEPASYFLVASEGTDQSFTIKVTDPVLIAQAREQIKFPQKYLPRIVIGKPRFEHGFVNRNLLSPLKFPWSWHVDVIRFADFGSIACDGNPQRLEDNLFPWLNSSLSICFWQYKVIYELSPQDVLAP
jgi:hypothetical protein